MEDKKIFHLAYGSLGLVTGMCFIDGMHEINDTAKEITFMLIATALFMFGLSFIKSYFKS